MNKLGMHVHGIKPGIIDAVALLQPRTITLMDPTPQELRDIYSVANPITVVRKYEDGRRFQETNPQWWAEENYRMVGDAVSNRLVALGWNEPFGHDAQPLCAPFDEWTLAFMRRCRELGPMDAGVLPMATGNWTGADDRYKVTNDFPLTCAEAMYFIPHEYCWPTLEVGVPWYTLRYRAWIEDLEATGKEDFFIILSEAGLTQAIIAGRPDHGFRSGGPEGVTEDSYISTIDWYNARLCEDWRVLGCCLYDYAGSHYGWETFEQLGLEHRIFQIQAPEVPEPPEPPNGDKDMIPDRVEIYDFDHGPHADDPTVSKEWLRSIFGDCIEVRPPSEIHQMQIGDPYWQVKWINCKPGTTSVIIEVTDEDDQPVIGETVIFGWPNADPHGLENRGWNWTPNGTTGQTEPPDGHVGPGMDTGSYYSPDRGECGPHFIWIWGDYPSEQVDGMGMLPFHDLVPGANHLHTEYGFRLARWGGEEPPVPPEDKDIAKALWAIEARLGGILGWLTDDILPIDQPFQGEYFNNPDLSGEPVFIRADLIIDFAWGDGSPDPRIDPDQFSVRWTGRRTFEAGTYRFHTRTDDGVRLWVDDVPLIDQWHDQSETPYGATVSLAAGEHVVRMEYYERGGGAVAKLWWEQA